MEVNWKVLAAFVLVCLSAGFIGSFFTVDNIPTWYANLRKPDLAPPNWVFAPVWTTLYVLMGVSAYLVWQKGAGKKEKKTALTFFGVQLILNVLWSVMFFGLRNPFYGLVEIVVLWIAIATTIIGFDRVSRSAAFLMMPYLLWVSFAGYLTYEIWRLNM